MTAIHWTIDTPATPDAIRAALTTETGLAGWWAKDSDVAAGPGGEHELRFVKGERTVVMRFRVDTVADDRVRWTCTANGNPIWPGTTLEWTFGDGRIRFEHAGFAEDQSPPYAMTVDGWKHFAGSLASYLSAGTGQPW